MNQKVVNLAKKYSSEMRKTFKELEAGAKYTEQITGLLIKETFLSTRSHTIEDLYGEKYISKENKDKLLKETSAKIESIKIQMSDLAKQAIDNGASQKYFKEYIRN
jgi:hypothetical protein